MADSRKALESLCQWLLHRHGPDSPEGKEAATRLRMLSEDTEIHVRLKWSEASVVCTALQKSMREMAAQMDVEDDDSLIRSMSDILDGRHSASDKIREDMNRVEEKVTQGCDPVMGARRLAALG